jgi:hypothetical protein
MIVQALPSFEDAIALIMEQEASSSLATSSLIVKRSENSFLSHISDSGRSDASDNDPDDSISDVFSTYSEKTHDLAFEYGYAPIEDFEHILLQDLHAYFYEDERAARVLSPEEKRRLGSVIPNHWVRDSNASYAKYISVKFGKGTYEPRLVARRGWEALRVFQPP